MSHRLARRFQALPRIDDEIRARALLGVWHLFRENGRELLLGQAR